MFVVFPTGEAVRVDFIHHQTPDTVYRIEKEWTISNGIMVAKRVKKS